MNELKYPEAILQGGGSAVKWIKGLTRGQLHAVVQDKELASPLLGELARNVPVKYLKNLIHHKKLEVEYRKSILRRIFRANVSDMGNQTKLDFYLSAQQIKTLTDIEKRVINSYIQEIKKLIKLPKNDKAPEKAKTKKKKKPTNKKRSIVLLPRRDSTLQEIINFLVRKRSLVFQNEFISAVRRNEIAIKTSLLSAKFDLERLNMPQEVLNVISMNDLLSYRMEIDQRLYDSLQMKDSINLLKDYALEMIGPIAKSFLEDVLHEEDEYEILYNALLKVVSFSEIDFEGKATLISKIGSEYQDLIQKMEPILNYGPVETNDGGQAKIAFYSSVNVEFSEQSFKFWKVDEDESYGFPVALETNFDFESRLNRSLVNIYQLEPGSSYIYGVSARVNGNLLMLDPQEFKMPDSPPKPVKHDTGNYGYSIYDYSVPLGGGGERRFQQY